MFLTIQHECREHVKGMVLLCRRGKSEGLQDTVFQLILNYHGCKDMNFFLILNSKFLFFYYLCNRYADFRQSDQYPLGHRCGRITCRLHYQCDVCDEVN